MSSPALEEKINRALTLENHIDENGALSSPSVGQETDENPSNRTESFSHEDIENEDQQGLQEGQNFNWPQELQQNVDTGSVLACENRGGDQEQGKVPQVQEPKAEQKQGQGKEMINGDEQEQELGYEVDEDPDQELDLVHYEDQNKDRDQGQGQDQDQDKDKVQKLEHEHNESQDQEMDQEMEQSQEMEKERRQKTEQEQEQNIHEYSLVEEELPTRTELSLDPRHFSPEPSSGKVSVSPSSQKYTFGSTVEYVSGSGSRDGAASPGPNSFDSHSFREPWRRSELSKPPHLRSSPQPSRSSPQAFSNRQSPRSSNVLRSSTPDQATRSGDEKLDPSNAVESAMRKLLGELRQVKQERDYFKAAAETCSESAIENVKAQISTDFRLTIKAMLQEQAREKIVTANQVAFAREEVERERQRTAMVMEELEGVKLQLSIAKRQNLRSQTSGVASRRATITGATRASLRRSSAAGVARTLHLKTGSSHDNPEPAATSKAHTSASPAVVRGRRATSPSLLVPHYSSLNGTSPNTLRQSTSTTSPTLAQDQPMSPRRTSRTQPNMADTSFASSKVALSPILGSRKGPTTPTRRSPNRSSSTAERYGRTPSTSSSFIPRPRTNSNVYALASEDGNIAETSHESLPPHDRPAQVIFQSLWETRAQVDHLVRSPASLRKPGSRDTTIEQKLRTSVVRDFIVRSELMPPNMIQADLDILLAKHGRSSTMNAAQFEDVLADLSLELLKCGIITVRSCDKQIETQGETWEWGTRSPKTRVTKQAALTALGKLLFPSEGT